MDKKFIKCPQCGAVNVDKVGHEKFQCPYCGYSFTVEGLPEFVKHDKDDFQVQQDLEKKKLRSKIKRNERTFQLKIFAFAVITFVILIGYFIVSDWVKENWGDRSYSGFDVFPSEYEERSFLEAAPFKLDGEELTFSDYARKVTINNVENEININAYWEFKLECSYDSSVVYAIYNKKKYARPNKAYTCKIFYFKNETELREYLCKKPFEYMGNTYSFYRDANSVKFNGQDFSDYVKLIINEGRTLSCGIEYRALIRIRNYGDLGLVMDEDGSNAYLLEFGTNKKYIRMN